MDGLDHTPCPRPEPTATRIDLDKFRGGRGPGKSAIRATALVSLAAAALLSFAVQASAERFSWLPVTAQPITVTGQTEPTEAWLQFCDRLPKECVADTSQPARISLTPNAWASILAVNEHVNRTILAVTDQDHWGVVDRWDYPDDGMGDCEDIQLLKRRLLMKEGLPQRAMRMAVVIDEQGAGHAVMMVLTDRGDFVLDNKREAVLPWQKTNYIYLKREGTNSSTWVALEDGTSPLVTANR